MKPVTLLEIGLVIFLAIMIILPFGIVGMVHTPQPYSTTNEELVREILGKNGINLMSEKETHWEMPGATGGKTYTLLDTDGQMTCIMTQTFDSDTSRDAAIRSWHASQPGRGRVNGHMLVNGRQIIIITPAERPVIRVIGPGLSSGMVK